jgi:hypothetical protein
MTSYAYPRNPTGIGGPAKGEARNPLGRSKSQPRMQLWFLARAQEVAEIIFNIARNGEGTKAEAIRLAACKELLDRGLGRAPQSVDLAVDMQVTKRLDEMTPEELLAFKAKYVALTSAAPAAIEHVIEQEDAADAELDLGL